MTPLFIKVLEDADMRAPVLREMSKNNEFDWSPRTPMLIINLASDRIVDRKMPVKRWKQCVFEALGEIQCDTLRS